MKKPARFQAREAASLAATIVLCLAGFTGGGCACFRTELSYQELQQRNLELKQQQGLMFKPGDFSESWGVGK